MIGRWRLKYAVSLLCGMFAMDNVCYGLCYFKS